MSVGLSTGAGILIGGGLAAAGTVAGSLVGAGAAGSAGQLQYQEAQQQLQLAQQALQDQMQARSQGITQAQTAAQMNPAEIKNINNMLTTQTSSLTASLNNIQTMQGQLNAMSPQIQAAGQDYYNLLTGQASSILAPLQQQQQMQRQQMQNSLAAQMGPGWATSSAGIQAMVQFDNQAAVTTNQAQMQAIQTVGSQYMAQAGMQQQGQFGIGSQTQSAYGQSIATSQAAAGAYAQNTQLQTQATLGGMSANQLNPFGVSQAAQSSVNTAPGMYAGQATLGQGIGNLAGGLGGTFGTLGTMGMLNGMYGGAPGGGGSAASVGQMISGTQSAVGNIGFGANGSTIPGASGFGGTSGGYNGNFGANIAL